MVRPTLVYFSYLKIKGLWWSDLLLEKILRKFMNLQASALMVGCALVLGGCGFDGGPLITEDIGTTVDDTAELSVKVKQALRSWPQTAILNIMVTTVSEDSVKLSGYVNDDATLHEAERVAGQVPGVRFVVNALNVRQ